MSVQTRACSQMKGGRSAGEDRVGDGEGFKACNNAGFPLKANAVLTDCA